MAPAPLAWLFGLEQFGIKLGLESITTILEARDRPERAFAAVHVGGTNGKGSVTAMIAASLQRAGFRTGRYTSPHLVDIRERFVVDGQPVDPDTLTAVVGDLQAAVERLLATGALPVIPTFFEVTTAAAFEMFRRASVDIAVCEVGLGGRLDATNVLEPIASAITSIGLDHEEHLGRTLTAIAAEKAGILKPGVPVILGRLPQDARTVIMRTADAVGAPVVDAAAGTAIERIPSQDPWAPSRIRLATPVRDYGELTVALRGAHQIANATTAVRVLEMIEVRGLPISPDAIAHGLASASWPGRLDRRVYPDGREVLLDAAHNPESAAALAAFLRDLGPDRRPLVFAVMRDKDMAAMLQELLPVSSALIVTRASNPRSEDPTAILSAARALAPTLPATVELDPGRALEMAWGLSPSVVVAGSIFLLGDVMSCLGRS